MRALFARGGVRDEDLPAVQAAVTRHSNGEAAPGEPHRRLIAFCCLWREATRLLGR